MKVNLCLVPIVSLGNKPLFFHTINNSLASSVWLDLTRKHWLLKAGTYWHSVKLLISHRLLVTEMRVNRSSALLYDVSSTPACAASSASLTQIP